MTQNGQKWVFLAYILKSSPESGADFFCEHQLYHVLLKMISGYPGKNLVFPNLGLKGQENALK